MPDYSEPSTGSAVFRPFRLGYDGMGVGYLAATIKRSNMELQFWGYEIGNVFAAIAGAGGFVAFYSDLFSVADISRETGEYSFLQVLFKISAQYPDLVVILGIGFIALCAPVVRKVIAKGDSPVLLNLWDVLCILVATALVVFAIKSDSSWIIVSGATFVVASSFLRFSHDNPIFLKLGAIFLQMGGIALSLFGVGALYQSPALIDGVLGLLVCLTGYYVFAAGTLTYEGGIFITLEIVATTPSRKARANTLIERILDPATGLLSRFFEKTLDGMSLQLSRTLVKPSLFWISASDKQEKPFLTSMKARLTWRLLTAVAAILSGTQAGVALAAANFCWAIGDIALGSLDWVEEVEIEDGSADNQGTLGIPCYSNRCHERMMIRVEGKYSRFSSSRVSRLVIGS